MSDQLLLANKIITNKFYLYADVLHKIKKIQKKNGKIFLTNMQNDSEVVIPMSGADILLSRMYTIGEVAKIVERRPDTIRKYERTGLIPKPVSFGDDYSSYKNWRFYKHGDVYEIVDFFSNRSPGRPAKSEVNVNSRIQSLNQKVKMTARSV